MSRDGIVAERVGVIKLNSEPQRLERDDLEVGSVLCPFLTMRK